MEHKSLEQLQNYASTMALSGERGIEELAPKSILQSFKHGSSSSSAGTQSSSGINNHLGVIRWAGYGPWTPEKIIELTKHWLDGQTARVIATKLGMNRNQIIGKANRLGLPPRKGPSESVDSLERRARQSAYHREWRQRKQNQFGAAPSRRSSGKLLLPHRAPTDAECPTPSIPTVSLIARKKHQCAWVCNKGSFDELTMCGETVVYRSYCWTHARAAYVVSNR